MFEQENILYILLGDRYNLGRLAQSGNARPFFKQYYEFQDGDSRVVNQAEPLLSVGPCATTQVTWPKSNLFRFPTYSKSQRRDKVAQLGVQIKNRFFSHDGSTVSLIWNQVAFHIQNPRQNSIPQISRWSVFPPRFFIIEIVILGLSIPLILTEHLIRLMKFLNIIWFLKKFKYFLTEKGINITKVMTS